MGENQLKPPNQSLMVVSEDMDNPWFDGNYSKVRKFLNEHGVIVDPYTVMEIVSVSREIKCRNLNPISLRELLISLLSNYNLDLDVVNELMDKILKDTEYFCKE
jgi:hypothetical protein